MKSCVWKEKLCFGIKDVLFGKHIFKGVSSLKRKLKKKYYPDISGVVSSGDCTGSVPTPPLTEAEEQSYAELTGKEIPKKSHEH